MARWTAKEIVLNIATSKEAIIFLEAIQKQIKIVDIFADYYPGKVTIRFEGAKENLQDAIEIAKQIHKFVNEMLYPDNEGYYSFDLPFLTKVIGKSVPIKTLLRILNLENYEAIREDDKILAKCNFNTLSEIITKLDESLSNMPYEVSTSSLRDVLATIMIINKVEIETAIADAKKKKIVSKDDLDRLILTIEPEQALEKCIKLTK
ncbi:MAG: DUF2067 family protein [Candidatus Heimdallarchaeota archaeon]|nr:DUF2067 family protein [Candidatus Heimdallarchaeota archaeon]